MNIFFIILAMVGWLTAVWFITWYVEEKKRYVEEKKKSHCPRCGNTWTAKRNAADTVYHCKKCGLTTYDSFKYVATMEDRSENY